MPLHILISKALEMINFSSGIILVDLKNPSKIPSDVRFGSFFHA